jgi:hypothetical protein
VGWGSSTVAVVLCIAALGIFHARAATIDSQAVPGTTGVIISVDGDLQPGDETHFANLALT